MELFEIVIIAISFIAGIVLIAFLGKSQTKTIRTMKSRRIQWIQEVNNDSQLPPISISRQEALITLAYLLLINPMSEFVTTTKGQMFLFFVIIGVMILISILFVITTILKIRIWIRSPNKY